MSLNHNERDCCGLWKQQLISGRLYWRGESCGAIGGDYTVEPPMRVVWVG